jgi:hypothetical protein
MTSAYCDDGYTLDGYLKEAPGLYPAVRFRYRPATPSERVAMFDGFDNLPANDKLQRIAGQMAKNVLSWDVKDSKGVPVRCNQPLSYKKLPCALYDKLQEVVFQISAPDIDPDKAAEKEQADAESAGFAEEGTPN